jgi:hypothetical protein
MLHSETLTPNVTLMVCSVRTVLPSNSNKFPFSQVELQKGSHKSGDPSYVPQGDQEQHLIQQTGLNDLDCELSL